MDTRTDMKLEVLRKRLQALQQESGIAEARRTLATSEERQELFRQLAEHIEQVFWMADVDLTKILYVSPTYEKLWGRSCESLYRNPHSFLDAIHPDDRQRVSDQIRNTSDVGRFDVEYRVIRPNGSIRWVHDRGFPIQDEQGKVYRITGIAEDVSPRKLAERRAEVQYAATRILAETATLAETLPKILQAVCESLGWEVGGFWLVDEQAGVLRCASMWRSSRLPVDEFEAVSRRITFAPGIGLPGRVWANRVPAWIPDVAQDNNFPRAPHAAKEGLHGAFGFPIRSNSTFLGVMEFFSHEIQPPDQDLLCLCDAIGSQIGQFSVRKQAEEALRESEAKYRAHLEQIPAVTYLVTLDSEDSKFYVSPQMEALLGFSQEEFMADADLWTKRIHADDRTRILTESAHIRTKGRPFHLEYRVQARDGRIVWVDDEVKVVKDSAGRPKFLQGVALDITKRKSAEEALRCEKDFAESLIEAAQAIVLVLDLQGCIVSFNPYTEEILGYRLEKVRQRDWLEVFFPEAARPRMRHTVTQALSESKPVVTIGAIGTTAGRSLEIKWSLKILKSSTGQPVGVLVLGHDITDLKEAQQHALQVERLATIGHMAAVLAHEGRNALQETQSAIDLLSEELEQCPKALTLLQGIQEAVDRHERIYEEIRGFAAPIVLHRQPCNLREILHLTWHRLTAVHKEQKSMLRELGEVDRHCPVDRFAIERVLRNVLENSFSACRDNVEITVRWQEKHCAGRSYLQIAIHDNGPGIKVEPKWKVFEPYITTKPRGTGLGLAIVKRIVEAHGGQISVGEHSPGTEIVITLPRG